MSLAIAVKAWVAPTVTVAGSGVTTIWSTAPSIIFTVVESLIVSFVAVTNPMPGTVWAVRRPDALIEPTSVLQRKSMPSRILLRLSKATAVNCWVSPTVTNAGSGTTRIWSTAALRTSTSAESENVLFVAVMVPVVGVDCAVSRPVASTVPTSVLQSKPTPDIGLL